ncbi:MAG: hypothetical protein ACRELZ_01025 [Candidatus Rokuibacteriota bacterium]
MRIVIAVLLSLAFTAVPALATQLGQVASTMPARSWAKVTTINIGAVSQVFDAVLNTEPGYDDNQAWNSKKRRMMIQTASDPDRGGPWTQAFGLIQYDDDSNTWITGGPKPTTGRTVHAYDHVAWDDDNEVLYFRLANYGENRVMRYCVNNTPSWCAGKAGTWSQLPANLPCFCQVAGGLTYHSALNGGTLLYFNGDSHGVNRGALFAYRETTGTWTEITPPSGGYSNGDYHNLAEYSRVKQVAVYGGGNGSRNLWKISASGAVTQLAAAPFEISLGGGNRSFVADPVSGNFILIGGTSAGQLYELNPDGGGTWTLIQNGLNGSNGICNVHWTAGVDCSGDFYGASNSTYGVIMYWKFTGPSSGELWLYKHSPTGPQNTPTQPPNLSVR